MLYADCINRLKLSWHFILCEYFKLCCFMSILRNIFYMCLHKIFNMLKSTLTGSQFIMECFINRARACLSTFWNTKNFHMHNYNYYGHRSTFILWGMNQKLKTFHHGSIIHCKIMLITANVKFILIVTKELKVIEWFWDFMGD
jgi:hypothetical protein